MLRGVMGFPGELAMPIQQLRLAVPGLAGLAGFMLFPTFGAWFRLALEHMEANRPGLGRPKRMRTLSMLRAAASTLAFAFFSLTLVRAASELRDVELEAPVVALSIQGTLVGIAFWSVYAIGLSTLRRDMLRIRGERRIGGVLR